MTKKDMHLRFIKTNHDALTDMSGKQGTLHATYQEIVDVLGEPCSWGSRDGKVQAEWLLQFKDGLIATIYDYKQYGTPVEEVKYWSIGGPDNEVVHRIHTIFRDLLA